MRLIATVFAVLLAACSSSTSPNGVSLVAFDFNENKAPQAGDVPYDSVRVDVGTLQVERRYAGNLCSSSLEALVSGRGSDVTVRVAQNPIASCGLAAGLVTWRATVQIPPGTWHLQVLEVNASSTSGALVLERSVTVPGR